MSLNDAYTDVVELCALLQCLGFSVKSLDTSDHNSSQDAGGTRTVIINCQLSGLHVVLESTNVSCSCPATDQQNSGVWQVSGVTGGKKLDKEFGCSLLGSLPKTHRDRLTMELREMIKCIKQNNVSDLNKSRTEPANKSTSMVELSTPEKKPFQPKMDTPTRYRSLDTLTNPKEDAGQLPEPGPLQRQVSNAYDDKNVNKNVMCRRQSTYTLSSTPGSTRRRNKTSSPIQCQNNVLDSLLAAEKVAEDLRIKISSVIKDFLEEGKNDSSMSSMVLDVSRISVLKGEPSKAQFASSPNLSGLGTVQEDFPKGRLKRFESASTSNLTKQTPKDVKTSRLRRLSPNLFKNKKDSPSVKSAVKAPAAESKSSKFNSLFRPKIVTPSRVNLEASPNISSSKKKFSHIKSTIPRPTKKE